MMSEPTDDEVGMSEEEVVQTEDESEQEESYIETLTREVAEENAEKISNYVDEPETPEETAANEAIKKFLVQKVRKRLLDSFEDQLMWLEDADLVTMMKKWKRATAKDDDVDVSVAMKRIIKETAAITAAVEQHLEEMVEEADGED